MSSAFRRLFRLAFWLIATLAFVFEVRAENDPAVVRGIQFLRGRIGAGRVGEIALSALAMLKSDIPANDPSVARSIDLLRKRFVGGSYVPEQRGGHDIYEAGAVAMALSNLDSESRRAELSAIAQYLVSQQKANGSWDYTGRQNGDTSIAQYAVLGLWEAENGGARVPPAVWDRAARWFMSTQSAAGSWNYHRDEAQHPETISMTAAGVGSLLICQRQLERYRRGNSTISPLLTPLSPEGQQVRYEVSTSKAGIEQAVRQGILWLGANFTTGSDSVIGQSAYYALYGIERIGALADKQALGRVNWFDQGRQFIQSRQRNDGAWEAAHGEICNTVWAILFITKSTAKTIRRIEIKSLGAGTLLGGRGLPKDLSNLTVAGGRVVSRPMNGAVEGMLSVLEDPRAENADSALSGLVSRYHTEGPTVLRPWKDRFRKLLTNRDPGLRRVAAWSLARTAELDVVPALIEALTDPDDSVARVAREGLQLLSRKIDGLGPPSLAPAERQEAALLWRSWYSSVRPLDLEGQELGSPASGPVGSAR
ncbi:MAG: hypothetical protein NVSMB9_03250 [Isosphaeraceae bacterium]